MPNYSTRKLEVYSLHVRNGDADVPYDEVFSELAAIPGIERQYQFANRLVAVPRLRVDSRRVVIHAYEGDVNVNPLIFHSVLVEERTQSLEQGEVLVHKTHAMFDLETRDCIVEYNQRGAKASDISSLLEMLVRRNPSYELATVDLNPVANADFEAELDRFGTIKLANMKLSRPNSDWTDRFNHLTAIGDESHAQTIAVEVIAGRGQTLSKSEGVVGQIRKLLRDPLSIFKAATVRGVRIGERAATSISLNRFIEHQRVNVRLSAEGHVQDTDIEEKMAAFLDARAGR